MPLLNYTTSIDSSKTLGEIQCCLARHGAAQIAIGYASGLPSAIGFVVPTRFGERAFRLPANIDAVFKTLEVQRRRGKVQPRFATKDQAVKVAWRILKDWIEAQMAIVESGMVTMEEVMLPYLVSRAGKTVYEIMCDTQLALPGPNGEK